MKTRSIRFPHAVEARDGNDSEFTHNSGQGCLAVGQACWVGYREYDPIANKDGLPIVVTGFEPLEPASGNYMCVLQLEQASFEVFRVTFRK